MLTLRKRIEKELKESLYKNKVYEKTKWSYLEKNIIHWSTNYKKYTLLLTLLFILLSWVVSLLIKLELTHSYSDFFAFWTKLIDWQGTFLGAQLTMVCVVYPLVISFISIFANQKTSNSVIFPIYKKYSGFMFAGLSGLALAIFILIGFFLRSFLDDSIYLVFCISSAIWLIFNISLTAWFFSKTFQIINDHSREEIILRFSIQEACWIDISKRLRNNFIKNAHHFGLIKDFDENYLKISNFSWDDADISPIKIKIKFKYELSDIKFYLINSIIFLQTNILKYKNIKGAELILNTGKISDENYLLGKTKKFVLSPFLGFFYRHSFSFRKSKAIENDEDLLKLFKNFIDPIHFSLRDNDIRAFKESVENLIKYHVSVSSTLAFINYNKKNDNWLLLADGSIFGRSYFDHLLIEYFLISKESVFKIIDNTEFYNEILYFHKRLYGYSSSLTDEEIKTHIEQNYNLWEILLEWYSLEIDRNARTNKNYEEILKKFVASWESWIPYYIEPGSKRNYTNEQTLLAFKTHLRFTAKTIIAALSFKNPQAVGWGVDMLNHWLENFKSGSIVHDSYSWNSVLLNIFILDIPEDDPIWAAINNSGSYSRTIACELAFRNYHLDLRVITACYLLKKNNNLPLDISKEMIEALLKGQRIYPTSISESPESISNAGELVGTYIRHRNFSQVKENSYELLLNQIVESYAYLFKGQLITGRTYMGVAENLNSLKENYIEIALSLSKNKWDLPSKWYQALSSSFYKTGDIKSIILDLESWISTLNTWQEKNYEHILFEKNMFSLLKENLIDSIRNIIKKLNSKNNQMIINNSVSQEKILALASTTSDIIQDRKNHYPFKFFKSNININKSINFHEESFTFLEYDKEYIVDSIYTGINPDDDNWIKSNISQRLTNSILDKILKLPVTHTYSSTSLEDLLQKITIEVSKIKEPILLVGSQELKDTLHRCRWKKNEFISNIIHFKNINDEGYICHIDKCEVYDLLFDDIDYILLTSKNIFESLSFYEYEKSQFFDVSFDLKNPNDLTGDLVFKYQMALKFNQDYSILKFNLNVTKDF